MFIQNPNDMKKKTMLFCLLCLGIAVISCSKKDKDEGPTDEEILTKRIEDIIPGKYLDSLEKLGLAIHVGTQPPQVEGSYAIKPHILDTSDIASDYEGYRFSDATVHLSNQSTTDFSIKLLAEDYLKDFDSSLVTAISGHDNYFTVYGKVKATAAGTGAYAIVAIIISGEKDGDNLKNIRTGLINIDASQADGSFIPEGKGRIAYDSDFISERIGNGLVPGEGNRSATPLPTLLSK